MFLLLVGFFSLVVGLCLGIIIGPTIHDMVDAAQCCQDLSKGEASPPLIAPGDYWKPVTKKRQSKGKRKGK
jgi:hypothetical protein